MQSSNIYDERINYMTIDQVCRSLGIGKSSAYNIAKDSSSGGFKAGHKWYIPVEGLNNYLETKKQEYFSIKEQAETFYTPTGV